MKFTPKLSLKATIISATALATLVLTGFVSADTYIVKDGDTLSKIADEKKTSVDKIVKDNHIENRNLIYVGQKLEISKDTDKKDKKKNQDSEEFTVQSTELETNGYPVDNVSYTQYQAPVTYAQVETSAANTNAGQVVLANGNTAGDTGRQAAAEMAKRTGVDASVWENIIARESNGQVNAYNPSGASGLFQTMPGWGSTATVNDQINAAEKAYKAQGLSAWGY